MLYSLKINIFNTSFHVEAEIQTKPKLGNVPDPIELNGNYAITFNGSIQSDVASDVWWPLAHLVNTYARQMICHLALLIKLSMFYSWMPLFLNWITNLSQPQLESHFLLLKEPSQYIQRTLGGTCSHSHAESSKYEVTLHFCILSRKPILPIYISPTSPRYLPVQAEIGVLPNSVKWDHKKKKKGEKNHLFKC